MRISNSDLTGTAGADSARTQEVQTIRGGQSASSSVPGSAQGGDRVEFSAGGNWPVLSRRSARIAPLKCKDWLRYTKAGATGAIPQPPAKPWFPTRSAPESNRAPELLKKGLAACPPRAAGSEARCPGWCTPPTRGSPQGRPGGSCPRGTSASTPAPPALPGGTFPPGTIPPGLGADFTWKAPARSSSLPSW